MSLDPIPVMRPRLPRSEAFLSRFESIGRAGLFTNFGPQVCEYEERIADFLGVDASQVVTMANATLAIAGVVSLFPEYGAWGVPSWTFTATAAGVISGGAVPIFLDIGEDSHWVSERHLLGPDPLVVVAPFGAPVPEELRQRGAPTVIDAAASLGSQQAITAEIAESNFIIFSLHATKVLGIGEGAVVVCGSHESARLLRSWSNFGFELSRSSARTGINAKMSEFAAAVAHASLDHWPIEKAEWLEARSIAREVASETGHAVFDIPGDFVSPYWIVEFPDELHRDRAEKLMEELNIGTRRWWSEGCHLMPAYREYSRGNFPNTEGISSRTLGMPFYRGMGDVEWNRIRGALSKIGDSRPGSRAIS